MENEAPKRIRINFWVTPTTYKFLEYTAQRDGRSMSDVIREALRDFAVKDREFEESVERVEKEERG